MISQNLTQLWNPYNRLTLNFWVILVFKALFQFFLNKSIRCSVFSEFSMEYKTNKTIVWIFDSIYEEFFLKIAQKTE